MSTVTESFGSMVFDERAMKARLSGSVYHAMKQTLREGKPLDPEVANAVAAAMRDWAVEKGATHFTHWFQPLTGVTAGAGRELLPLRRPARDFRSKRLHRLGPDLLCVHQGKDALHPHGFLFLWRRSAG